MVEQEFHELLVVGSNPISMRKYSTCGRVVQRAGLEYQYTKVCVSSNLTMSLNLLGEMVDTRDSKSLDFGRVGSSPSVDRILLC